MYICPPPLWRDEAYSAAFEGGGYAGGLTALPRCAELLCVKKSQCDMVCDISAPTGVRHGVGAKASEIASAWKKLCYAICTKLACFLLMLLSCEKNQMKKSS